MPDPTLPSFRTSRPTEEGGPIARAGFAYQDHVAAWYCLGLLTDASLKEVWCETYDDIVLVFNGQPDEVIEFVQVKAEFLDQLWTPAELCRRKKSQVGTSILERSLNRAIFKEPPRFRMVTLQNVGNELQLLCRPRNHSDRTGQDAFNVLAASLEEKLNGVKSKAGHTIRRWLELTEWTSGSQSEFIYRNKSCLLKLLESMGVYATSDTVDTVYDTLVAKLKLMSELKNVDHEKKFLSKASLTELLRAASDPHPNLKPSEKLSSKLSAVGCDEVAIAQAQELRRAYRIARITRPFLNLGNDSESLELAMLSKLHGLLSAYDSGSLTLANDRAFHDHCIAEVNKNEIILGNQTESKPHERLGCMYEITSRCRHRYTRSRL